MFTRRTLLQMLGITAAAVTIPAGANTPAPPAAPTPPPPPQPDASLAPARITKLELFLRSRRIKPAHLARESGYARAHLLRVRMGRITATADCAVAVVSALRRLAGERVVLADVFDRDIVLLAHRERARILRETHPMDRRRIRAVFGREGSCAVA